MGKTRKTHLLFLIAYTFLVASIFLTPIFAHYAPEVAEFSYKAHSHQCHQLPSRSPHMFGYQLPECWRCTAIFVGFLIGIILVIRLNAKVKWWWAALATIPLAADGFTQFFHLRASTNQLRMVTGFLWGVVGALWLVPFTAHIVDKIKSWLKKLGRFL